MLPFLEKVFLDTLSWITNSKDYFEHILMRFWHTPTPFCGLNFFKKKKRESSYKPIFDVIEHRLIFVIAAISSTLY